MACNELRIGTSAEDIPLREGLPRLMLELVQNGQRDPVMIRIHAVHRMRRTRKLPPTRHISVGKV